MGYKGGPIVDSTLCFSMLVRKHAKYILLIEAMLNIWVLLHIVAHVTFLIWIIMFLKFLFNFLFLLLKFALIKLKGQRLIFVPCVGIRRVQMYFIHLCCSVLLAQGLGIFFSYWNSKQYTWMRLVDIIKVKSPRHRKWNTYVLRQEQKLQSWYCRSKDWGCL